MTVDDPRNSWNSGSAEGSFWKRKIRTFFQESALSRPRPPNPTQTRQKPRFGQSKSSQRSPKVAQRPPKVAQSPPKVAKTSPKVAKTSPKVAQSPPKVAKTSPKSPKGHPDLAQTSPGSDPKFAKIPGIGQNSQNLAKFRLFPRNWPIFVIFVFFWKIRENS